jgi:hypothetical protein
MEDIFFIPETRSMGAGFKKNPINFCLYLKMQKLLPESNYFRPEHFFHVVALILLLRNI